MPWAERYFDGAGHLHIVLVICQKLKCVTIILIIKLKTELQIYCWKSVRINRGVWIPATSQREKSMLWDSLAFIQRDV